MPQFVAPQHRGAMRDAGTTGQHRVRSVHPSSEAVIARPLSGVFSGPMHLAQDAATHDAEADRVGTSDVRYTRASSPFASHRSLPAPGARLLPASPKSSRLSVGAARPYLRLCAQGTRSVLVTTSAHLHSTSSASRRTYRALTAPSRSRPAPTPSRPPTRSPTTCVRLSKPSTTPAGY